jgi:hypothetical protein
MRVVILSAVKDPAYHVCERSARGLIHFLL